MAKETSYPMRPEINSTGFSAASGMDAELLLTVSPRQKNAVILSLSKDQLPVIWITTTECRYARRGRLVKSIEAWWLILRQAPHEPTVVGG